MKENDVVVANRTRIRQVSFDSPMAMDDNNEFTLYDVLQKEEIPSPDNNLMLESNLTNVGRALQKLPNRESEVLTMTFGLFQSRVYTLSEIAENYEITTERVRQIRASALNRLKALLEGKDNLFT